MNTEVISAFLDNEVFDPRELGDVLADADGRATLLHLIALRQLVQPPAVEASMSVRPPRRASMPWLRAAVVLVAIGAGYAMGTSFHLGRLTPAAGQSSPPAPTVVVHRTPDAGWQPVKRGE